MSQGPDPVMRAHYRRRRIKWIVGAVVAAVVLMVLVIPAIAPGGNRMNQRVYWLDVTAGRMRCERYLLGFRISDRVEDTALTALYREYLGEPPDPRWHRTMTFGPIVAQSPDHAFRATVVKAFPLRAAFATARFDPPVRKAAVTRLFDLLQSNNSSGPAENYALAVLNLACVHHGQTITVEMLSTVGAAAATQPAASQPGD